MKSFFLAAVLILIVGSGIYLFLDSKRTIVVDNSPQNSATITAREEQKLTFNVFFGNKNNEKEGEECKAMSPIEREVPYTIAAGKEAIDKLLEGPTDEEKEAGYYTNINEGVILQSLIIENGTAKADFSSKLEEGVGGSCKVTFIRSQITETLKQFDTIKEVIISINGRTEDVLQP